MGIVGIENRWNFIFVFCFNMGNIINNFLNRILLILYIIWGEDRYSVVNWSFSVK